MRIAIGIATAGRVATASAILDRLARQSRPADKIIVCGASEACIEGLAASHPGSHVLVGRKGLTLQRNDILDLLAGFDVAMFFDDDFVPAEDYLANVAKTFEAHPDIVMATGHVIADGATKKGITLEEADRLVAHDTAGRPHANDYTDLMGAYGCNMSMRLDIVRANHIRFDENLPLYSWLEDLDFGSQMARHGRIVRDNSLRGVHLGTKSGRQPGRKLGYSQVANPVYLARKGTLTWRYALYSIGRNLAANTVRSFSPEPWVDRRGRIAGNAMAFGDLVTGRLDPGRILSL